MMSIKKWSILMLTAFTLSLNISCGTEAPQEEKSEFKNCKYKPPVAIFSTDLPEVNDHRFDLKDREGVEIVAFKNNMKLELIQTGCDKITQSYNFTLPGQYQGDGVDWMEEAIKQFEYLGNIGLKYGVLTFWSQAMREKKGEFGLGQAVEVQPGFYAEVNKVVSSDYAVVTVKLSEK